MATTTAKRKTEPLLLSQRGRMFLFGAEGLVKVLCIHLFQNTTVPKPSQSQSIYPCEGLIKQDSTIILILQVVESGRERISTFCPPWQKHIWGRKLSIFISQFAHVEHIFQKISHLSAQINILVYNVFAKVKGRYLFSLLSRCGGSQWIVWTDVWTAPPPALWCSSVKLCHLFYTDQSPSSPASWHPSAIFTCAENVGEISSSTNDSVCKIIIVSLSLSTLPHIFFHIIPHKIMGLLSPQSYVSAAF